MPQNEQQKFLEDVAVVEKQDQLEAPLTTEEAEKPKEGEPAKTDEDPEKVDESIKNRRHRRLEAQLRNEREANIAMAERLRVIAESKATRDSESASYLKDIERVYGTNSPEALEATNLLKAALQNVAKEAEENAVKRFREEQAAREAEVRVEEQELDNIIEDLEDSNGVALTKEQKQGYFRLLEKMSPKDSDGNVIAYADPESVWEEFQAKLQSAKKPQNKAKDFASRSMAPGQAANDSNLQDDSSVRFLKEHGII